MENRDKIITQHNEYKNNKDKTDIKFPLIKRTRNRLYRAFKGKVKSSSTIDILGIDFETYRRRIEWLMTTKMNWKKIEIDHVKPNCMFDVPKDEELTEAFCWEIIQPSLRKDHQYKGTKFIFTDYHLQLNKSYQFLKLNEEGLNKKFH